MKVNANELLSSVENELNQTFKEKALQKFKEAKLHLQTEITNKINLNY